MNQYHEEVRVHRRGRNPNRSARVETATIGPDGRLYVRCNGAWWLLSDPSAEGWRSINVGICDPNLIATLDSREQS